MRLLEYEAKRLLTACGVECAISAIVHLNNPISTSTFHDFPLVVKSQVPVGGRGKAGGVRIVHDKTELEKAIEDVSRLAIKGYTPTTLLVEQALAIDREFYLSMLVNRERGTIDLIAHNVGGVDIEQQHDFMTKTLDKRALVAISESVAELYGIEEKTFVLQDILEKLYHCFTSNDATLLEINPLVVTRDGQLIAGDCKMTLDDAAAFRHPDWNFEDKPADANFVTLDPRGTVATIANGAGLAMATVDAVEVAGLVPANFLDIGGGATTEKVVASFRQIMKFKEVNAIVINIFGGIVQCDTVAQAIIEAKQQLPALPRLYIRLSGNRSKEAAALLSAHGLPLYSDLGACIKELRS